jgi:hypothetical protein
MYYRRVSETEWYLVGETLPGKEHEAGGATTSEHDWASASQPHPSFWIGSKMNHGEQNFINELVALLIKEDLHTRAIAEQLRSNHATVRIPVSC